MRNLKKVLALVLAMAMSLSLAVTAGASYNTFPDQDKIVNEEAVYLLNALGIVEGRDTGDFDPTANINRAEAAKLVAALNLAGVPVPEANGVSTFTDVLGDGSTAWANDFIEYCVAQGSVNGIGNDLFAPKAPVTGVQFAKMLLGILGYKADVEKFTGSNWEYYVNTAAVDAGLYIGLKNIDFTAPLSRDNAAQMMYNALKAFTVIYLTDTTGALEITKTNLMKDKYPTVYGNAGIMTAISYNTDKGEYTYTVGSKTDIKSTVDYTDMLGMNVMYVIDRVEGTLGLYAYDNGAVVTGLCGDFDLDKLIEDKIVDTSTEFDWFEAEGNNVDLKTGETVNESDIHCYYEYKAIDNDNDGTYDNVIIYGIAKSTVTAVGSKSITIGNNRTLKFSENTIYSGVAVKDNVTGKYDTSLKTVFVVEELPTLSGKVDSFRGDSNGAYEITISGKTYDVSCEMAQKINTFYTGKNVKFQVINDYVVAIAIDNSVAHSQFLMVTSIVLDRNLDGSYNASALMADGSTETIAISKLVGIGNEVEYTIPSTIAPFLEQRVPAGEVDQRGYVAKYDVVDGKYELTPLHKLPAMGDSMGFDHYGWDLPFVAADDNTKDAFVKIGNTNYMIADDATIFLVDVSGSAPVYSVVTGADIKHITGLTNVCFAGTEYNETTGYSYVTFAHVVTNNMSRSAWMNGILTSDVAVYSGTDAEYAYFTMWDGEKDVTMNVKLDSMVGEMMRTLDKGTVIEFRVDAGMIVEGHTVYTAPGAGYRVGAVTQYDPINNADKITIKSQGGEVEYTIDKDANIFFFDTSEKVGVANGTITLGALKDATDLSAGRWSNVAFIVNGTTITDMVVDTDVEADIVHTVLQ